ncbi:MAG: flagellar M-ring protein FliF, partial [Gemmobacter sp.]|uniref:flagellar basal-body MS-ring/collar protein FliF n=1 Tax=Gemmobacter sp. TaxID=1898957 RepID=UPI001A61918B
SGEGYELLDGLSGFGTTSQMFDAAYWRAKEGELARTILATPGVKAARVHLAQPGPQLFQRDSQASASVTVTMASGSMSVAQARAFKHLVASAVSGMAPEDVSVIDAQGGLIQTGSDEAGADPAGNDRAAELRRNVERLLEARVGHGKAVVEVSLDVVNDREQITERKFDPQSRVAISTETQEKSGTSSESAQDVSVASNLPEGDAAAGSGTQSQNSETRERVNFEVSETQREVVRGPGTVRRLTVAVLVDGLRVADAEGAITWQPRPEEELAVLRELVASAVGLDESRGDVLTLKSLAFEATPEAGTLAEASLLSGLGQLDVMSLVQVAVLALVALVLGLFVLRPILTSSSNPVASLPAATAPLALPGAESGTGDLSPRVVSGEIDDIGEYSGMPVYGEATELPDDPVERLRRLIDERQAESVEILRGWLEAEEERA